MIANFSRIIWQNRTWQYFQTIMYKMQCPMIRAISVKNLK